MCVLGTPKLVFLSELHIYFLIMITILSDCHVQEVKINKEPYFPYQNTAMDHIFPISGLVEHLPIPITVANNRKYLASNLTTKHQEN